MPLGPAANGSGNMQPARQFAAVEQNKMRQLRKDLVRFVHLLLHPFDS